MDTGQLTGSGQIVGYLDTTGNFKVEHFYLLTMHGGPCDGQIFTTVD